MSHTAAPSLELDRAAILARFERVRRRSRELFGIVSDEAYYTRPIALRNPIVFYEGHLVGFAVNTLLKKALGQPGIDESLEVLFARGIDPEQSARPEPAESPWPSRDRVLAYVEEADARLREALATAPLHEPGHPLLDRARRCSPSSSTRRCTRRPCSTSGTGCRSSRSVLPRARRSRLVGRPAPHGVASRGAS
jgi:hypothetical protein